MGQKNKIKYINNNNNSEPCSSARFGGQAESGADKILYHTPCI